MDTSNLKPLTGRWPGAVITQTPAAALKVMRDAFSSGQEVKSAYSDVLALDQADKSYIQDFATQNKMSYQEQDTALFEQVYADNSPSKAPAWLGVNSAALLPVFAHKTEGVFDGFPIKFGIIYIVGNESQRNLISRGVVRVKLPKLFPQIVLDSRGNDKGLASSVLTSFKSDQRLQLEGDFPTYFDLYAPKNTQVSALSVLAPNFMEQLTSISSNFDVEFYGHEMILTTTSPLYTPETIDETLQALKPQLEYLTRLLTSWQYTPTEQPLDVLQREFIGGPAVSLDGRHIQPKYYLLTILTLVWGVPLLIFIILTLRHHSAP